MLDICSVLIRFAWRLRRLLLWHAGLLVVLNIKFTNINDGNVFFGFFSAAFQSYVNYSRLHSRFTHHSWYLTFQSLPQKSELYRHEKEYKLVGLYCTDQLLFIIVDICSISIVRLDRPYHPTHPNDCLSLFVSAESTIPPPGQEVYGETWSLKLSLSLAHSFSINTLKALIIMFLMDWENKSCQIIRLNKLSQTTNIDGHTHSDSLCLQCHCIYSLHVFIILLIPLPYFSGYFLPN